MYIRIYVYNKKSDSLLRNFAKDKDLKLSGINYHTIIHCFLKYIFECYKV